jgi:hypothetical protein
MNVPQPTVCHNCGTVAAEAICHICKEERPAYAALKNMSERLTVRPAPILDHIRRCCEEAI